MNSLAGGLLVVSRLSGTGQLLDGPFIRPATKQHRSKARRCFPFPWVGSLEGACSRAKQNQPIHKRQEKEPIIYLQINSISPWAWPPRREGPRPQSVRLLSSTPHFISPGPAGVGEHTGETLNGMSDPCTQIEKACTVIGHYRSNCLKRSEAH